MVKTFNMPLSELISQYSPVYPEGGSWDLTCDFLLNDEVDKEIVDTLVSVLKSGAGLREPVVLGSRTDDEDDPEFPLVVNGTHRVCAHILAGVDTVLAAYASDVYDVSADEVTNDHLMIETVITFTPELNEEVEDKIGDVLRSFEVDETTWFEVCGEAFRTVDGFRVGEFSWVMEPGSVDEDFISEAVLVRLNRFGLDVYVRDCVTSVVNLEE